MNGSSGRGELNGPPPAAVAQLATLMKHLQSPDTEAIKSAESQFDALTREHPVAAYDGLSYIAAGGVGAGEPELAQLRANASVLLRQRIVRFETAALEGGEGARAAQFRQRLLAGLSAPALSAAEKRKLCGAVAALGAVVVQNSMATFAGEEVVTKVAPWPELLPSTYALAQSQHSAEERASGLYLFAVLMEGLDDTAIEPHLAELHAIIGHGLADGSNAEVRGNASRALRVLLATADSKSCGRFVDLIPGVLSALSQSLNDGEEEDARAVIEDMVDSVQREPRFWRRQLDAVVNAMITVASSDSLEDETRQVALEMLTELAEALRGPCKKLEHFTSSVIPLCMNMMAEVEDDEEWYTKDSVAGGEEGGEEADAEAEYTNVDAGQESLDRLAIALGGKAVLPVASQLVQHFLQSSEWNWRHAGIMAINQIGEGCRKQMEAQLEQVLRLVLAGFSDPHPRVRYAAINCVGQMSTDFGGVLQRKFHQQAVPALVAAMDDSCNRVKSHAAAALINFCDEASVSAVQPYLDSLVGKLLALLNTDSRLAQEQAMTAVAAVASSAENAFSAYYDTFMPPLKNVLRQNSAGDKRMRLMRGKTMECITLIGVAVGGERFEADADEIMQILVGSQQQQQQQQQQQGAGEEGGAFDADDPQIGYMMQAYARICKSLGEGFTKYLPYVMPHLCEAAKHKPDIQVFAGEDDDDDEESGGEDADGEGDSAGYATVNVGDKRVGIRTSALEDRATAVSILASFAADLGGAMFPYLTDVTSIMLLNLSFWYHDDCRIYAANTLPDLVKCARQYAEKNNSETEAARMVKEFVAHVLPKVYDTAAEEHEPEVQGAMIEAVAGIVRVAGQRMLDASECAEVAKFVLSMLQERKVRVEERLEARAEDAEADDEELNQLDDADEWDDEVLSYIGDVVHRALEFDGGSGFIAAFEAPLPKPTVGAAGAGGSGGGGGDDSSAQRETTSLSQAFASMLSQQSAASDRRIALCAWCDWIEFGGERGLQYLAQVLPAFCTYVRDPHPEVRQAACYGLGVCARCAATHSKASAAAFMEQCARAHVLASLEAIVTDKDARAEESCEQAADNAATALLRIVEHYPSWVEQQYGGAAASVDALVRRVLEYLPIVVDDTEANAAVEALARAVRGESGASAILARQPTEVAAALARSLANDEEDSLEAASKGAARAALQSVPQQVMHAVMERLTPEERRALQFDG